MECVAVLNGSSLLALLCLWSPAWFVQLASTLSSLTVAVCFITEPTTTKHLREVNPFQPFIPSTGFWFPN